MWFPVLFLLELGHRLWNRTIYLVSVDVLPHISINIIVYTLACWQKKKDLIDKPVQQPNFVWEYFKHVESCLGIPLLDLQSCNIEKECLKHTRGRTRFSAKIWVWQIKISSAKISRNFQDQNFQEQKLRWQGNYQVWAAGLADTFAVSRKIKCLNP